MSVGEVLVEQFLQPRGWTMTDLAAQSGLPRKHVAQLCRDRRAVTPDIAQSLARVFGNSPEFWLNAQRSADLWESLHKPPQSERMAWAIPDPKARRRMA